VGLSAERDKHKAGPRASIDSSYLPRVLFTSAWHVKPLHETNANGGATHYASSAATHLSRTLATSMPTNVLVMNGHSLFDERRIDGIRFRSMCTCCWRNSDPFSNLVVEYASTIFLASFPHCHPGLQSWILRYGLAWSRLPVDNAFQEESFRLTGLKHCSPWTSNPQLRSPMKPRLFSPPGTKILASSPPLHS
jgi:hypothetical protein